MHRFIGFKFFNGLAVKAQQVTAKQTAGVFPLAAASRALKNAFEIY
jgi:hypothetical protein